MYRRAREGPCLRGTTRGSNGEDEGDDGGRGIGGRRDGLGARGRDAGGAAARAGGDQREDDEGHAREREPSRPSVADRARLAGRAAVDTRVVMQVGEADVGPAVVLVFRVVGAGRTTLRFALTRGDASPKALRAVRYDIRAT